MPAPLRLALAAFGLAISTLTPADTAPNTSQLALEPGWLTLGHYRPNRFGNGYTSQADDQNFFLNPLGELSPKAELDATLAAIQLPGSGDGHARCRFPARDRWLRARLDLPEAPISCPAFEQWQRTLNTDTVTMVFAASYLNSPSSMFGHTFLRLDPPSDDQSTDLLLANTISYAADAAAHDSELLFAYKGIFGGYPGITTVQPYYDKLRLYTDIENRDLWEYTLNLTPDEVDQLLAHAWEIRDRNFDYYFFDENCAYRLLALIDVARPGTNLLGEVSTHAIPSDTVRWIVDKDLVSEIHYRPSAATTVSYGLDQLPAAQRQLAAGLAQGNTAVSAPEVSQLDAPSRARLLDATYDYVRYQSEAEGWPRAQAAPLSHNLLRARSEIDDATEPSTPPPPAIRDDQGHDTFRVSLGKGRLGDRSFSQLTLRPAYHDLLDPPDGYRRGAQLQFLRLDARYYTGPDELQLERLIGVEIRSLSPRDDFFSPLSWQVGFGGRRTDVGSDRVLTPYLEGGAGGSWALSPASQTFALVTADLEIDDDIHRGYDFAPGVDVGLLYQSPRASLLTGVRSKAWIVSNQHRQDQLYLNGNVHLGRRASVFAEFARERHFNRYQNLWQLGLHGYF
ncbi:Lnb N-terminal periplasmic domain-containing protein [Marinobacter sp. SS21]|uniref:Lnb N-terminal periplasmic domain-containing protein n=1 Tax=Marinobacter sp. SS21 TaxID=2979460 RepID=UPI00232EF630|nr:DUF4105 domain-containing protein [Marinobacter sp. SS21]MDC0662467.1 DUF4105 domain-containing protein [Marinobacter sp. SS21]